MVVGTSPGCVANVVEVPKQRAPGICRWLRLGHEVKGRRLEWLRKGFQAIDLSHLDLPWRQECPEQGHRRCPAFPLPPC